MCVCVYIYIHTTKNYVKREIYRTQFYDRKVYFLYLYYLIVTKGLYEKTHIKEIYIENII